MIILADTGVLVRLFNPADPKHIAVQSSVRAFHFKGEEVAYCLQNASEFWNVCTRPVTARGGLGLDIRETQQRLSDIEATLSFLDEPANMYRTWTRLVFTHQVKGRQVHDAKLVALMQLCSITHIMTLNPSDFTRYTGIVTIDPTKP